MLDYTQATVPAALRVVRDEPASYDATPKPRERFAMTPAAVLTDAKLSRDAKCLYGLLALRSWPSGQCQVDPEDYCKLLDCKRRALYNWLRELIDAGYVDRAEPATGERRATYTLPFMADRVTSRTVTTVHDDAQQSAPACTVKPVSVHRHAQSPEYSLLRVKERDTGDISEASPPPPRSDAPSREVYDYFKTHVQPLSRTYPDAKIKARLKKFSVDELKAGIDNFCADGWYADNCKSNGAAWFFASDPRSEKWLLLTPRTRSEMKATGTDGRRTYAGMTTGQIADEKAKTKPGFSGYNHAGMAKAPVFEFGND